MKTYKHYLVQDIEAKWTYGVFDYYGKAHTFIQGLILPDSPILEIFGTDENPETYLTGDTLYILDTKTNQEITPEFCNSPDFRLAKRIYKLIKKQDWTGEADSLSEIYNALNCKEGLYSMVEFLTAELEVMEG